MVIKAPPPSVHESIYSEIEDNSSDDLSRKDLRKESRIIEDDDDKPKPLPKCQCIRRVCPPRGRYASILTFSVILVTFWAVCFCVLGEVAMPGKTLQHYNICSS